MTVGIFDESGRELGVANSNFAVEDDGVVASSSGSRLVACACAWSRVSDMSRDCADSDGVMVNGTSREVATSTPGGAVEDKLGDIVVIAEVEEIAVLAVVVGLEVAEMETFEGRV